MCNMFWLFLRKAGWLAQQVHVSQLSSLTTKGSGGEGLLTCCSCMRTQANAKLPMHQGP